MFFKRKGHLNFQPQIFSTFFKKDLPGHFDFVFLCPPNQRKVFMFCISMNQNVFKLIEKADRDLADVVHNHPCPHCGGKLHWANCARSPRGLDKKAVRFSLCCAQDGCRRRQTPESIRFLGRKVYPGLIVVLVSALNNGLSPKRVAEVRKTVAVSRATLNRWWIQGWNPSADLEPCEPQETGRVLRSARPTPAGARHPNLLDTQHWSQPA